MNDCRFDDGSSVISVDATNADDTLDALVVALGVVTVLVTAGVTVVEFDVVVVVVVGACVVDDAAAALVLVDSGACFGSTTAGAAAVDAVVVVVVVAGVVLAEADTDVAERDGCSAAV